MVTIPTPSKKTLLLVSVICLIMFSGCMGLGGSEQTPTENNTTNNSTLDIKAGPDGGESTNDSSDETTTSSNDSGTPTTESTDTPNDSDGSNSEDSDGGIGDFISGILGSNDGESSIDENETKIEFTRNYEGNVTVIVTSVGPAEHLFVVDSNDGEMYSTMSGEPSYTRAGVSDDQFLVSGESGDEGTTVSVAVSGSGTVRVVSVAEGQEQTVARYDYNTEEESN